jgi:hypothetical protein
MVFNFYSVHLIISPLSRSDIEALVNSSNYSKTL